MSQQSKLERFRDIYIDRGYYIEPISYTNILTFIHRGQRRMIPLEIIENNYDLRVVKFYNQQHYLLD